MAIFEMDLKPYFKRVEESVNAAIAEFEQNLTNQTGFPDGCWLVYGLDWNKIPKRIYPKHQELLARQEMDRYESIEFVKWGEDI